MEEGGGGSLPYPVRLPAGEMGVRGKRGRFPQAGPAGLGAAEEPAQTKGMAERGRWRTSARKLNLDSLIRILPAGRVGSRRGEGLRDSAGRFRYMVGVCRRETAKAQGTQDLAVTPGPSSEARRSRRVPGSVWPEF